MTDVPLLSARALAKRFGGLAAVNGVSLDLHQGRIHAVIGPNGAGKSTLTNLLSGDLVPTSGEITLGDSRITGWSPEKISRAGLGRSYQKTNIFQPFTVWENVRLAAQSRAPHAARWLRRAGAFTESNERAQRALELSGLAARRDAIAGTISHGEQRQLEIAMTLATGPRVLLLDEPLAGLSNTERSVVKSLIASIPRQTTVIMIEHDMDTALDLAETVTLLNYGRVIVDGDRDAVIADQRTREVYLGV
jgi:branched-chain amino acid transport system ATP-binding protein